MVGWVDQVKLKAKGGIVKSWKNFKIYACQQVERSEMKYKI
jgi:hypothetical protein